LLDNTDDQYRKDYADAMEKLEAEAAQAIPSSDNDEENGDKKPDESIVVAPAEPEQNGQGLDEKLKELQERLAKAEKAALDNKAWGTKNAQRLAEIERERIEQQREQAKPEILDANPDLADAIRYVTQDPAPQHRIDRQMQDWQATVQAAHPGIFDVSIDPELEAALVAKREALGEAWFDPLTAIREITAEKIAFTERQVGKRFAIEAAKQTQKSAMSVPGAGGSANRTPVDPDQEAAQRILKMSDAEFAKEVKRVKGY
jgi:hypothetical protein